jgi:hypothetical protein
MKAIAAETYRAATHCCQTTSSTLAIGRVRCPAAFANWRAKAEVTGLD